MSKSVMMVWTALLCAGGAAAAPVCKNGQGVAVSGYDVVAFFTAGKALKGKPEISARHQDAEYRFVSAGNRDKFLAEPARYLPQFGGYCTAAMGQGKKVAADPENWVIHKGKLYLMSSRAALDAVQKNLSGAIAVAAQIWDSLQ